MRESHSLSRRWSETDCPSTVSRFRRNTSSSETPDATSSSMYMSRSVDLPQRRIPVMTFTTSLSSFPA